jgi:hypothetical protein
LLRPSFFCLVILFVVPVTKFVLAIHSFFDFLFLFFPPRSFSINVPVVLYLSSTVQARLSNLSEYHTRNTIAKMKYTVTIASLAALVSAHGNITSPAARLAGPAMAAACGQAAVDAVNADGTIPLENITPETAACRLPRGHPGLERLRRYPLVVQSSNASI